MRKQFLFILSLLISTSSFLYGMEEVPAKGLQENSKRLVYKNLNEQLYDAIEQGDANQVRDLLDRGAETEPVHLRQIGEEHFITPLACAIYADNLEIAEILLTHGANPNYGMPSNYNMVECYPLGIASIMGNLEMCTLLLVHGADADNECILKSIPQSPNQEVRRLLIKNLVASKKAKADHVSLNSSQLSVQKALSNYGPNNNNNEKQDAESQRASVAAFINTANAHGETALHYAVERGNREMCELLLEHGASPDVVTNEGKTPLHIAGECGHKKLFRLLRDHGADQNIKTKDGKTSKECLDEVCPICTDPLLKGCVKTQPCSHAFHGECLSQWRANKNTCPNCRKVLTGTTVFVLAPTTGKGLTPLMQAVCDGNVQTVTRLIEEYKPDRTINLLQAAAQGNLARVNELIRAKADLNIQDHNGCTALTLATARGNADIITALLDAGANAKLQDKQGKTAFGYAANSAIEQTLTRGITRALVRSGAKTWMDLMSDALINAPQRNVSQIEELLATGCDVHCVDAKGRTPLHVALINSQCDVCPLFINAGVPLDAQERQTGRTALMLAANGGEAKAVEALVRAGANLNMKDRSGKTALFYVINPVLLAPSNSGEYVGVLRALIRAGADLSSCANNKSALICAIEANKIEFVKILVEGGAFVNKKIDDFGLEQRRFGMLVRPAAEHDPCENVPLVKAIKMGYAEIAAYLINMGAEIVIQDNNGFSRNVLRYALDARNNRVMAAIIGTNEGRKWAADLACRAAELDDLPEVQFLLNAGIGSNCEDEYGRSLLCNAVTTGNSELVNILIAAGADVNSRTDQTRYTPLMRAFNAAGFHLEGSQRIIDALIAAGANINDRDYQDSTCAHIVTYCRLNWSVANYLAGYLKRLGADLNAQCRGRTPLMIAAESGNRESVTELLAVGVNTELRDDRGRTALGIALRRKNQQIIDALIKKSNPTESAGMLLAAIRARDLPRMQELLDAGVNVNYCDAEGDSVLMHALFNFSPEFNGPDGSNHQGEEILELLIRAGANINHQNNDGFTPLMRAMREADPAPLTLIRAGADVNLRAHDGTTALMRWAQRDGMNNELLRELLQAGVHLDAKDEGNRTALIFAAMRARPHNLIGLLEAGANPLVEDATLRTARNYANGSLFRDPSPECAAILQAWTDRARVQLVLGAGNSNNIPNDNNAPAPVAQIAHQEPAIHEDARPMIPPRDEEPIIVETPEPNDELAQIIELPNLNHDVAIPDEPMLVPIAAPVPESPRGEPHVTITVQPGRPNYLKWGVIGLAATGAAYGAYKLYKWLMEPKPYQVIDLKTTINDLNKQVMRGKQLASQMKYKPGALTAYFVAQQKAGAFAKLPQAHIAQLKAHIAALERELSQQAWNEQEYQALRRLMGQMLR